MIDETQLRLVDSDLREAEFWLRQVSSNYDNNDMKYAVEHLVEAIRQIRNILTPDDENSSQ